MAPFTAQSATLVDNGIGDGLVGRCSMTFKRVLTKIPFMGMANDDNALHDEC